MHTQPLVHPYWRVGTIKFYIIISRCYAKSSPPLPPWFTSIVALPPFSLKYLTMGWSSPFSRIAHHKGVFPSFVRALTCAPFSIKMIAASSCPPSAASCRGVQPKSSSWLTTSGLSMIATFSKSTSPSLAAVCISSGWHVQRRIGWKGCRRFDENPVRQTIE